MTNVREIYESHKSTGDIVSKTMISDISQINCFVATNNITNQYLYISSFTKNLILPELKNYRFKGVEFFSIETGDFIDLYIYLLDNDLRDIFVLFIQNIIENVFISKNEGDALNKTLDIVSKWKRLFDKISFGGLSLNYQKGLIGELLYINSMLDVDISANKIINSWTGPDLDDKDFRFGNIGVEIKLTSSKQPKLKITNEGQLDSYNLGILFLVLYVVEQVNEDGYSLNSLVSQIRSKLVFHNDILHLFNEKLLLLGYLDSDEDFYKTMFATKEILYYTITDDFPKIIKSQLTPGIYSTSYSIELSAAENFRIERKVIDILIHGKSTY